MALRERVVHEFKQVGLVTLYFLTWFLIFLTLKKLLLDAYDVRIYVLSTALLGALVVAKVVIVLDKTNLGERFSARRGLAHVAWRSLAYTTAVMFVVFAEHLFHAYREEGALGAALRSLWSGRDPSHFMAMWLVIGLSFVVYNTLVEIDHHLGRGGLRRVLLGGAPTASQNPSRNENPK